MFLTFVYCRTTESRKSQKVEFLKAENVPFKQCSFLPPVIFYLQSSNVRSFYVRSRFRQKTDSFPEGKSTDCSTHIIYKDGIMAQQPLSFIYADYTFVLTVYCKYILSTAFTGILSFIIIRCLVFYMDVYSTCCN